jgi:tetratricopeptide (TPR) repeat protein
VPLKPALFSRLVLALIILLAPFASHAQNPQQTVTTVDRGWDGLANVLDALTPSIQTEDPASGAQINAGIEQLLNKGDAEAAFRLIEQRESELATRSGPGTDVQLMFQKARALAQLNRTDQAQALYQEMTIRYPELPQPWNNLAVLYIAQGSLDEAALALETAIMNNPRYAAAISNLADLRVLMALKDYERAAALGSRKAARRADQIKELLIQLNTP